MWLSENEIEIFEKVFEREDLNPKNRKGSSETEGFKLKELSFYYSDTKAITNVCKNLKKLSNGDVLAGQYTNVLKKMALIDKDHKITKFGEQLLLILHYDDNKFLNEISKVNINVESLFEEIPYILEFFLFLVVVRSLREKNLRETYNIDYKSLAFEAIDNLEFFFSNVIDTLNETSNKIDDVSRFFGMDKNEFYYFLQGINFNGYEVKRFLKLTDDEKNIIVSAFNRSIECTTLPRGEYDKDKMELENGALYYFSEYEKKYRRVLHYYKSTRQKDIRNRIKHSILNYILFESMRIQNNKIKFEKNHNLNKIIKFEELERIIEKYDLHSIANLVYFNRDSKYLSKVFKFYMLEDFDSLDTSDLLISEPKENFNRRNINVSDKVIITDVIKENFFEYSCVVKNITTSNDNVTVSLSKDNKVNENKLDVLKKHMGGKTDV